MVASGGSGGLRFISVSLSESCGFLGFMVCYEKTVALIIILHF